MFLKDVMKEEQVLPKSIETDLKIDLTMICYKSNVEKDATLDIQEKLILKN